MRKFEPGEYVHYKGGRYEAVRIVKHTETEEELVLYRLLYGDGSWWVRPLTMFMEDVEVDGKTAPRFKKV